MPDPTLEEWHALYTAFREKFPEGPELSDGTKWWKDAGYRWLYDQERHDPTESPHTNHAAICIMLDWAMRAGAWWVQDGKAEGALSVGFHRSGIRPWCVSEAGFTIGLGQSDSHHAAYYAAIKAIADRG